MKSEGIPGYSFGTAAVAPSPLTLEAFQQLQETVLFSAEDIKYLRLAGTVLEDQIEAVLDTWYGFVGSHPFLAYYFTGPDGQLLDAYLAAVRRRFGQWIRDLCRAEYDRDWLNYQQEIALRHTRQKKNQTDGVQAAADHIPLRYMIAFIYPITATIRPFLAKKGHTPEEVENMFQAWFKAVVLSVTLWSAPYAQEGMF